MKPRSDIPTLFERITAWTGSIPSLVVHTLVFLGAFLIGLLGIAPWEIVLLVLTTIVSLEAIYLSLLIQMTVNRNTAQLREVEEDIDEIQEDVEEMSEDIDEITEDIDEIQEDVEEMSEEEEAEAAQEQKDTANLEQLTQDVKKLLEDLEALKRGK